jgi:hypothetical protein
MKKHCIIISLLFLISLNLFAGDDKGNGGNAVVCYSETGEIESASLLDFYEASTFRFIFFDLETPANTLQSKIDLVVSRLVKFSPDFANNFKINSDDFLSKSLFLRNIRLTSSEDSFHFGLPSNENCVVKQVIHQNTDTFQEDFKYIVNLDLWEMLPLDHKVGLILHEVVYGHLLFQKTSRSVRYFTSLITSKRIDRNNLKEFVSLLKEVGFTEFAYYGYKIDLTKNVYFQKSDKITIWSAISISGDLIFPFPRIPSHQ